MKQLDQVCRSRSRLQTSASRP